MANQSLCGKLVSQTVIKSDGDVFHELLRDRPHHISQMSPANVQICDLHEGDWGKVGSVIFWNYTHEGKKKVAKEIIEAIDESERLVKLKVIEGDLLKLYNKFYFSVHVDFIGENNLVVYTLEYEKRNPSIPDPHTFLELLITVAKDIETHHLK